MNGGRHEDKSGIHRNETINAVLEPFILSGYRPVGTSLIFCVKSAFKIDNNEFVNFWSHFIPSLLWAYWLLTNKIHVFLTQKYMPLLCIWLGGISYTFFSSFAHLFNSFSDKSRHFCFFVDYTGIALYEMGSIIVGYYYYRPLHTSWFQYEYTYLALSAVVTLSVVPISCLSRFFWLKQRYLIRSIAFSQPLIWAYIPIVYLYLYPDGSHIFLYKNSKMHFVIVILNLLLFVLFVCKIPERLSPGKFDLMGNSHQLTHICAAAITTLQFQIVEFDLENRWTDLSGLEIRPTFGTTIGLLLFCFVWMLGVCLFIFLFVYTGRLRNKEVRKIM